MTKQKIKKRNIKQIIETVPTSGQIEFIENHLPPFKDGDYTINAKLNVNAADEKDHFSTSKKFAITGERFSIPQALVNNVFPLPSSDGEYSNVLPHIVLTRKTLPWERQIQEHAQLTIPWLALLLLDHNEAGFTEAVSGTVENLYKNSEGFPANTISYPLEAQLQYGQQKTDTIQYLDLPIDLFNEICPAKSELTWLAHARQIFSTKKAGEDETMVSDYSAVMCNRLPLAGSQNTVHLISLEGLGPYLPSSAGNASRNIPNGTTTIRLASLYRWSFSAWMEKESFTEYLKEMVLPSKKPFNLRLPDLAETPTTESQKYLQNALEMGYVPMDHQTRRGDHTVSWYRGPLLPYKTELVVKPPYYSSDQASRYNPESGMFDISYAMAWELGRLTALADKQFSQELYTWKKSITQQQAIAAEEEIIHEKIKNLRGDDSSYEGTQKVKPVLMLANDILKKLQK